MYINSQDLFSLTPVIHILQIIVSIVLFQRKNKEHKEQILQLGFI